MAILYVCYSYLHTTTDCLFATVSYKRAWETARVSAQVYRDCARGGTSLHWRRVRLRCSTKDLLRTTLYYYIPAPLSHYHNYGLDVVPRSSARYH